MRYVILRFLLLLAAGCFGCISAMANDRPNILFCFADDWGWPHAGAYGDPVVKTPAFDRIASEGVLFERAYISSPSCTPSRNAIITGQQFYRLGQGANLHSTLNVEHPNFMRLLQQAGYEIGHWRKAWGPGKYRPGGYDKHPCGPNQSFDQFMDQRSSGEPFCFWLGTSDPHRGYKQGSGAESGMDLSKIHVPEFLPDHDVIRSDIADYYFEVQRWDSDVADALERLEQAGELDNTIIVISGDHGMPFPRGKGNLYDWGSRVPLAVRWGAGAGGGRRVRDLVSLTDLAPTFLEAAGIERPDSMTGHSLMQILRSDAEGQVDESRDAVVYGRERHVPAQAIPSMVGYPARAIRTDRYLYITNLSPNRWPAGVPEGGTHPMGKFADCDGGPTKSFLIEHADDPEYQRYYELCFARRPAEELYDVRKDPDQINNLADDVEFHETKQKLRGRLVEYLRQTEDPRFSDAPVKFDDYPYRTGYIEKRLQQWRNEQK